MSPLSTTTAPHDPTASKPKSTIIARDQALDSEATGSMDTYEVIIVGGGWCGIIAAKVYLQTRPGAKVLVIDGASTLGGTWCKDRLYPHLVAEAHYGLFEYSDLEMTRDRNSITEFGLISGEAVHNYLSSYATKFDLHRHLRLNTKVESASRVGQHWHLTLSNSREKLVSEKLIVATGLTSEPLIPEIPGNGFPGQVLHSKELGKLETINKIHNESIRTVAVYGGSKSAFDAVNMLLHAGKRVQWILRGGKGGPSVMTPLTILGRPSFKLNNSRLLAMFSPNLFATGLATRWLHRTGPAWLVQRLVRAWWRLITYLLMSEAQYEKSDNSKLLTPTMGLDSLLWSPATLGVMTHPDLWKEIHEGTRVQVRQNTIEGVDEKGVRLGDGTRLEADMVILATGWKSLPTNFIFSEGDRLGAGLPSPRSFDEKTRERWERLRAEADGQVTQRLPLLKASPGWDQHRPRVEDDFHLYRSIAPASANDDDRSLAYIGFLRTTSAPIVYEAQALWACAYLQNKLHAPPPDVKERETAAHNAWVRRRYLCGRKVPFALFDFLPYIDLLYSDLGINSRRKGNPISEFFGMYKPSDFRGVVDEFIEGQRSQTLQHDDDVRIWPGIVIVIGAIVVFLSVMAGFHGGIV
ncbi:cofactor FMO1 enzyme is FAD [Colletotrichum musicola]|uniref:Cofactor FMO1 enzyme is FAD n=1 Tax=Colletotrichum musicola TaxID=2175873 RepID=A0A8H6NBZ6_9PEZI|nr:cofactor FMO1 enzyme is FAD [Colletotrichum musicola]